MSRSAVKNLLKYGLTTLVGALMVWAVLSLHGFAKAADTAAKLRILADAFTIPGTVITLFGVLVILANEGAFEGVSYVVGYAFRMLIPGRSLERPQSYADYVLERREKGKVTGFGFLFWVGGAFLLLAVVFTVLFFKMS